LKFIIIFVTDFSNWLLNEFIVESRLFVNVLLKKSDKWWLLCNSSNKDETEGPACSLLIAWK